MSHPNPIGILVSGRGSNMRAIIENTKNGSLCATVAIVISDNPDAEATAYSKKMGIPTHVVTRNAFDSKTAYENRIVALLNMHAVQLVVLAGYMKLAGPTLLSAFPSRIMNIHPSLLPAFPGMHAVRQAWEYGVKHTGCTVHFVDTGVDTGPIVLQRTVPVQDTDSLENLEARVLAEEHIAYSEAIRLFFENKLTVHGRKTTITR